MTLPLLHSLSRRLGVVIQWASDLREFLKNVSGIQILPTMLLLSMSSFIELLNLSRLSYHVWAKKMSMVYSCNGVREYETGESQINVIFSVSLFLNGRRLEALEELVCVP